VTKRGVKDIAASVRARLQTNAKQTGRPFQEVLQYFAMERLLFRLSVSPYVDKLVLKGGLMLTAWRAPSTRPTKDIDFLARIPNDVDSVVAIVKDICGQEVDPDGLVFDIDSVEGRVIKEDADYEGVRITFLGYLQKARVTMQIDMGFGDVVVPGAILTDFEDGFLNGKRYLIMDRDTQFCAEFRSILEDEGVKSVRLPPQSPDLNPHMERFLGSLKSECLSKMIFFGEKMLRTAIGHFVAHYRAERNHQGLDNRWIDPGVEVGKSQGEVQCRERVGGLLRYYHRDAA